jgi:hypothetical protein
VPVPPEKRFLISGRKDVEPGAGEVRVERERAADMMLFHQGEGDAVGEIALASIKEINP